MNKLITILAACFFATSVLAAGEEMPLKMVSVSHDTQTLERGMDAFMLNCHTCHSMKYVTYRDLVAVGLDPKKVDGWRGDQPLSEPVLAQMSASDVAQSVGVAPPDLSLMAKAREGGPSYVYSYLLGYYSKPDGSTGNHYYPPTKMPDILSISSATDSQRADIEKTAHDIVSMLSWAADPHADERIRMGKYVMAYLIVLTILLYFVKKRVWAKLH